MTNSDKNGEEASIPEPSRDGVADALDVQLTLTVGEHGGPKILGAKSQHLLWLDHCAGLPPSLRESLESALDRGLACLRADNSSAPLENGLALLSDSLAAFFRVHEQIDAAIHLQVFVEEHALKAGEALLQTFTANARDEFWQKVREGSVNWRAFNEQIEINATNLSHDDTNLKDKVLPLQLGEELQIEFSSKRAFLITGIRLKINDLAIAESADSRIINENSNTLALPQIPIRYFDKINKADGKIELVLILGTQRREICWPLLLKLRPLTEPPIALFIDMGSMLTKSARVLLRNSNASEANLGSKLRDQIQAAANFRGAPDWAIITEPAETAKSLESRGIPPFDKAELAKGSDQALAAWVAEAIRTHAQHAANRRNAALSHVYWSFPQVGVRDFDFLNRELQRLAGAYVLDRIVIMPEHDCLKRRFGNVLNRLCQIAVSRKSKREEAKREKREFDESFLGHKYWFGKPGPVPELEEWHKRFIKLNADSQLREVIIMDAGGFSLDVHAKVLRDGQECYFNRSFEAGGQQLTEKCRKVVAKDRGCEPEEVSTSEAERYKCGICSDMAGSTDSTLIGLTSEIYREPISKVVIWIRERTDSKALPVILTGGGMENRFLRELVREMLAQAGIASDFFTSTDLQILMKRDVPDHERNRFNLFMSITSGFSNRDTAEPRLSNDIVGGLIHAAGESE